MPPKRPKGIQKTNNQVYSLVKKQNKNENDPQESCTSRHCHDTPEQTSLLGEEEYLPEDDLEACRAMYIRAKSMLFQQENLDLAVTLLRGTIHECHRIGTLPEYVADPKRFEILAGALFLLGIYKTEQDIGTSKEFFEISREYFASLSELVSPDKTLQIQQALEIAILIDSRDISLAFSKISNLTGTEPIHLLHFLENRRSHLDAPLELDLEKKLWQSFQSKCTFGEFGTGNVLFQKASTIFNQMTEDMDEDTICEDPSTFQSCLDLCKQAIEHLNEALKFEDHPRAKHFLPLAECFLLQANIGEILDYEPERVIELYSKSIENFEIALAHDLDSVDEEVLAELKQIVNEYES